MERNTDLEKAQLRTPGRAHREENLRPTSMIALLVGVLASVAGNFLWWFLGSKFWPLTLSWLPLGGVALLQRSKVRKLETESRNLHVQLEHLQEWKDIAGKTGLVGCVTSLQGSIYHPKKCMESEVNLSLDFMGHGASKWTADRELLDKMLRRMFEGDGEARFLILDPQCAACRHTSLVHHKDEDSDPRMIVHSLMIFKPLKRTYGKHLQIRLYDHRPQLRLTFLDHFKVIVGHYRANQNDSKDSPLHIYTTNAEWSFYSAYHIHFEDEWQKAKEVDWDGIDKLHNDFGESHQSRLSSG